MRLVLADQPCLIIPGPTGTFARHPFDDKAHDLIHDLAQRIEQVSNDLYSAQEERQTYAALTLQQKEARTLEFEEMAEDAQADAAQEAEFERSAAARETVWAASPPELTAPGRYYDSAKQCGQCGGRVETIDGVRRCWGCFRRSQDGRYATTDRRAMLLDHSSSALHEASRIGRLSHRPTRDHRIAKRHS